MTKEEIIQNLPYQKPFLFVDKIDQISENVIIGNYTFDKTEPFYEGHFKNNPITPGVILTECMAQIGVVCLGIYLMKDQISLNTKIALSNFNIDFYRPVFPGEKITVHSEKIYFRLNKLKCKVRMTNGNNDLVCLGEISGMIGNS